MLDTLNNIRKNDQSPNLDERLPMLKALIGEIRLVHDALASKLDQGVNINNLDVIEASLHNELATTTKQILLSLKDLRKITEAQTKAIEDGLKDKPKEGLEKVIVENLKEAPTDIKVNNLSDLNDQFKNVIEAVKSLNLSVNVPEAVVNVQAPIVNVPNTVVNVPETVIPEVDLSPIIRELDLQLNKIRTNSETRPLAVRLTDGQRWIKELRALTEQTKETIAAFPGALTIKAASGALINPATEESISELADNFAVRIDDYSTASITYIGKAKIGSATSSAVWKVKKMDETTGTVITWAGNGQYNQIWDNRTSLTYA